jgi:hypothetical protein
LALAELKVRKLYREYILPDTGKPAANFEDFCQSRWGWSRQNAVKLIGAAAVIDQLPEKAAALVKTVNAGHALSKVPAKLRQAVVEEISKSGKKVSASEIKKSTPPVPPPQQKKGGKHSIKPASKTPAKKLHFKCDETRIKIPDNILPLWDRSYEPQQLLTFISSVRGALRTAQDKKDLLYAEVNFSSALAALDQAYADLKTAKPFAVCPTCQGELPEKCTACKGRGFVSEFYWEKCVTKEQKEMREKAVNEQFNKQDSNAAK